jgi:hypothetical protein
LLHMLLTQTQREVIKHLNAVILCRLFYHRKNNSRRGNGRFKWLSIKTVLYFPLGLTKFAFVETIIVCERPKQSTAKTGFWHFPLKTGSSVMQQTLTK